MVGNDFSVRMAAGVTGTTKSARIVHGDDLLYRFLRDMLSEKDEHFRAVPKLMIQAMGVWFPCEVYREFPVLLPWVVRDASCRGNKRAGIADAWGAPDESGYFRDDNSLVKSLPRSLTIHSPGAARGLRGARMGTEFVASHIWREVRLDRLASRHPLLNSFVPNLVWLPSQISKLSDREGGPVQSTLQSMAWSIYRDAPVVPHLRDVVDEAWSLIPEPTMAEPVDASELNLFEAGDGFLQTWALRVGSLVAALERLERGEALETKVISGRYTDGLPHVDLQARLALREHLQRFVVP